MKITVNGSTKKVPFSRLDEGDCFLWNEDYLLRIEETDGGTNAVSLEDGADYNFDNNDEVIPVEAEIVIK